ncbi:unnamed protein product, partial [Symbiodinium sp. CCMP2592]
SFTTLRYLIGVFLRNNKVQRQAAKKTTKIQANKLRVQDPILAWQTSCLWVHFSDDVKKRVTDKDFINLERLFLTGCLDRELQEKCRLMDGDLCLDNFRFLQVYTGVAVAPEQLQDKEALAEEQQETAALNLFSVKLEREVKLWERYQQSLQEFNAGQKDAKSSFRREQDAKLKDWEAVANYTQKKFPCKALPGEDAVMPYIRSCSADWADSENKSHEEIHFIYTADLTSLGSSCSRYLARVCRILGDALAAGAERSVAVVVGPNVASFGNTYEDEHVEKAQDDVEQQLRQDTYDMSVKRAQLCFAPETFGSTKRSLVHPMWVCVNKATDANGKLLSRFANSSLWHHRACMGIQAKGVADFVNPVQGVTIQLNTINLSKAQQYKQHISGPDLWLKVQEALWKGLAPGPFTVAVYANLLPYDHGLIQACLQRALEPSGRLPREAVISGVWAYADEASQRSKMADWLKRAADHQTEKYVKENVLKLPNLVLKDFSPEGVAPTYDTREYVLTAPVEGKHLSFRQDVLDVYDGKFSKLKEAYEALKSKHNAKHNPSGVPYKGAGKRTEPDSVQEVQGEPFPDEDSFESLDKVKATDGHVTVIQSQLPELFELVFSAKNAMYLHAKSDGVLNTDVPLMDLHGEFLTGKEIAGKKDILTYKLADGASVACFSHPDGESWKPPFTKGLATLKEFIDYLTDCGFGSVTSPCHEISIGESGAVNVKEKEACAYLPKKIPSRTQADNSNAGSFVDFMDMSWTDGEHKKKYMKVHMHFTWVHNAAQGDSLTPGKPRFLLTKPRRLQGGRCYKLT